MRKLTRERVCDAISKAVEWGRANPDKIVDRLAKDSSGARVGPQRPEATCFCALGRVAKELGEDYPTAERPVDSTIDIALVISEALGLGYDRVRHVARVNDHGVATGRPLQGFNNLEELCDVARS